MPPLAGAWAKGPGDDCAQGEFSRCETALAAVRVRRGFARVVVIGGFERDGE